MKHKNLQKIIELSIDLIQAPSKLILESMYYVTQTLRPLSQDMEVLLLPETMSNYAQNLFLFSKAFDFYALIMSLIFIKYLHAHWNYRYFFFRVEPLPGSLDHFKMKIHCRWPYFNIKVL